MNVTLLEEARNSPYCVISVMGDHAGESVDAIFQRKSADIEHTGKTFWLMRSPKAQPLQVQSICSAVPAYTIFVEPATKGGARPTTADDSANEYSDNGKLWHEFPEGLSPVTGKLDTNAAALVFDMLAIVVDKRSELDLWGYGDLANIQKPLKFMLGCSTVCAVRNDLTLHSETMKSRYRRIVAVARLAKPYCVWIRKIANKAETPRFARARSGGIPTTVSGLDAFEQA